MKQYISRRRFLCAAGFALSTALLSGCGGAETASQSDEAAVSATPFAPRSIACTLFPVYDLVRALLTGAEREDALSDVSLLLSPGAEAHGYEPTPKDILAVADAALTVSVGGESDAWAALAAAENGTPVLRLLDGVSPLPETDDPATLDEHFWVSPRRLGTVVAPVCEALCALYPESADALREAADALAQSYEKLDELYAALGEQAKRTIVLGDRCPFLYLSEDYGLNFAAAFPGCSADTEVSAATMTGLIERVRAEKTPTVFYLELSSRALCDTLCEETGAAAAQVYSGQTLSASDFAAGITLYDMLLENLTLFKEAVL